MAILSDQGWQDVRASVGAERQSRPAAKNGGNAAVRRPCRTTPIADDALWRPYRWHAARPRDGIHPRQRRRGDRPGLGRDRRRHRHQPGRPDAAERLPGRLNRVTHEHRIRWFRVRDPRRARQWLADASTTIRLGAGPAGSRHLPLHGGHPAAATVLGGALVALAIPLAALLATTGALLDILVWGVVAVLLQLLTVAIVSHLLRGMRAMIEAGQVAAAIPLVAAQLSIGLLNAAAMVPA